MSNKNELFQCHIAAYAENNVKTEFNGKSVLNENNFVGKYVGKYN